MLLTNVGAGTQIAMQETMILGTQNPLKIIQKKIGSIFGYFRFEFKDDKRPYFQGDKYNFMKPLNMKPYSNEKMNDSNPQETY